MLPLEATQGDIHINIYIYRVVILEHYKWKRKIQVSGFHMPLQWLAMWQVTAHKLCQITLAWWPFDPVGRTYYYGNLLPFTLVVEVGSIHPVPPHRLHTYMSCHRLYCPMSRSIFTYPPLYTYQPSFFIPQSIYHPVDWGMSFFFPNALFSSLLTYTML